MAFATICEIWSVITWFGKKEKRKQSEVNIHLCRSWASQSPQPCAYPLSGPSAGVRRSHLVCLCRNGGTVQITATGVFFLPHSRRFVLFERVQPVPRWHQQRAANVFISDVFFSGLGAQDLAIPSRFHLQRSPCPQQLKFSVLEVKRGFFEGKLEGCSQTEDNLGTD